MRVKSLNRNVSIRLSDKQFEELKIMSRKLSYEKNQDITTPDLMRKAISEFLEREGKK